MNDSIALKLIALVGIVVAFAYAIGALPAYAAGESVDSYSRPGTSYDDMVSVGYTPGDAADLRISFCNADETVCFDDGYLFSDLSSLPNPASFRIGGGTSYWGGGSAVGGEVIEKVIVTFYGGTGGDVEFEPDLDLPFTITEPPPPVPGCTDPAANNYDPEATEDDASCEYPIPPVDPTEWQGVVHQIMAYQFQFYLGILGLLLAMWLIKRYIFD